MRSASVGAAACLLGLALPGCGEPGQAPPVATSSVEAEVDAFLLGYREALEALDTARIRGSYVDDGRFQWLEDGRIRYRSADDVLAGLAGLPPGARARTVMQETRVTVLSDRHVAVDGPYETTFEGGDWGGFSFRGTLSMVLERGEHGWRIVSGHASTERPDPDAR